MPNTQIQSPTQNYFELMYARGDMAPEVVASAQNLFEAANAGHDLTQEPREEQYVRAARFGHEILQGLVQPEEQQLVDDASNALGHLRLVDRMRSGAQINEVVGIEGHDPSATEESHGLTSTEWLFKRNNAIRQAGTLWSGASEEAFNPPVIHEARRVTGQITYESAGPDLGMALIRSMYADVSPVATLAYLNEDKVPGQVMTSLKERLVTAFTTQVLNGEQIIRRSLLLDGESQGYDKERLQEQVAAWVGDIRTYKEKVGHATRLYHVAGRVQPTWLLESEHIIDGGRSETNLTNAYEIWATRARLMKFDPQEVSHNLKAYDTILRNPLALEVLNRQYAGKASPNTLEFANRLFAGEVAADAAAALNLVPKKIVSQSAAMITNILKRIPSGMTADEAVKLMETGKKPPVRTASAERAAPKKPKPAAAPKPVEVHDFTDVPVFEARDITHLPRDIAGDLIRLANKQRVSAVTLLNQAARSMQGEKSKSVNSVLQRAVKALLDKKSE